MIDKNINDELLALVNSDTAELLGRLSSLPPVEIAEFLSELDKDTKMLTVFKALPENLYGDIFCEFSSEIQNNIYTNTSKKFFAQVFNAMPSDSRADFYKQLDAKEQVKLLPYLSKSVRDDVISLSLYSDNTAGGIMSTDFATLYKDMTVVEAMDKLRIDAPSQKMIYCAYVVDSEMTMLGYVSLRDLIISDTHKRICDFLHTNFVCALVDDDKEKVASMIERYSLTAIPILNEEKQLVGIVSSDDAISVIKEEQTEDIEKLMGIVSDNSDQTYLEMSVLQNYLKRIGWIVSLFFLGILTTLVLNYYEHILSKIPILTPFFPMISAVGGNTGSQTSSVIVRALSLNEVTMADFMKVIWKEMKTAMLMAMTLFFLVYGEVFVISFFNKTTTYNHFVISGVVSLALLLQVIVSMTLGALLPLMVKFFNKDPAVVASPAITTIVDVTGIIIYFSVAMFFLI